MKKILAIVLSLVLLLGAFGCAADDNTPETPADDVVEETVVNLGALNGPTGISAAKLASDAAENGRYNVFFAGAPDEISAKLIKGELDAACVPTNLASVIYNKTEGGVKVAAVTTLGVLYLIDATGEVASIEDVRGKTIYATGQGSNPEYILNYILERNGMTVGEDVFVEYKTEHAELAPLVISGECPLAMLPVPFATQVTGKLESESVIDLQAEWAKVSEAPLAQGVLVVRSEFAENNPEALAKLLADFEQSSEFAVNDPEAASALVAELGIIPSAETALAAIPSCNIVYVDGADMKATVSGFLGLLHGAAPASIGGAMPGDDFYLNA